MQDGELIPEWRSGVIYKTGDLVMNRGRCFRRDDYGWNRATDPFETPNPQETAMALFEVAFTLVPNVKAQEAGAEETLLVAPVAVVAKDAQAAISRVAADNATKIQGIDGSTLKTHVRDFPAS